MLKEEQLEGLVLEHLGLVMSTIKKLGLLEKIDERLPLDANKGAKITMGERTASMILNGTGFVDDRLYMFPEFLANTPVDRFFRPGVEACHFNDDALGRCLDAIYEYGVSKLFSELAFEIGTEFKLLGKTARFDTTSLIVYGLYQGDTTDNSVGEEVDAFHITHGYSKDGRGDLKQMILTLATTGKGNLPIWMSAHSGNASDKIVLQKSAEKMKKFADALKEAPSFIFVGDSAMYEKCVERAGDMLWLSRVPHVCREAKEALSCKAEELNFQDLDKGYKISKSLNITRKELKQRWVVVYSDQKYQQEEKTLATKIAKEHSKVSKRLWHLSNQEFSCQKDAEKAIKPFLKQAQYHEVSYEVVPISRHMHKGRPKAGIEATIVGYQLKAELIANQEAISLDKQRQGRFILATNQLDASALSNQEMLIEYKNQIHTEGGFRFIKSDTFEVSNVFLKNPNRIQALMMIMTLCLMVYNLAGYFLHQALESNKDSIPNQLKKATNKPTMAHVFKLFRGVQVMKINFGSYRQEIVTNMNHLLWKIVRYFGSFAEKIYGLSV